MDSQQQQLRQKFANDMFARLELQRQFSYNLKQAVFNRTIAGDPEPSCLTWLWLYKVLSEAAIALWLGQEEYLNWGADEEHYPFSEDDQNECVLASDLTGNCIYIVDVKTENEAG